MSSPTYPLLHTLVYTHKHILDTIVVVLTLTHMFIFIHVNYTTLCSFGVDALKSDFPKATLSPRSVTVRHL